MQINKLIIAAGLVGLLSMVLHVAMIWGNRFYFTMDQGRDALAVRQILGGDGTLIGPRTEIKGLFAGVGWYYLLLVGYGLGMGHPVGGVGVLIVIQSIVVGLMSYFLGKRLGWGVGILMGLGLTVTPTFFDTAWYAFNPHLLALLTMGMILGLSGARRNQLWPYLMAAAALGLVVHSEVAFLPPAVIIFIVGSICLWKTKRIQGIDLGLGAALVAVFWLPHLVTELFSGFDQTRAVLVHFSSEDSVFSNVPYIQRLGEMGRQLLILTAESMVGIGNVWTGSIFWSFVLAWFVKRRDVLGSGVGRVILFTILLWGFTWLWFSVSTGQSPWHLVGLPPVVFLAFCLSWSWLPRRVYLIGLGLIVLAQTWAFYHSFSYRNGEDPSWLKNQLAAIDWVYQQADGGGFNTYIYLPSVLDFSYQYLIPWHGRGKYGYLPCEYSTYPGTSAVSYVKDSSDYQETQRECKGVMSKFLIIEAGEDAQAAQRWREGVVKGDKLAIQKKFGELVVERWEEWQDR